MTYASVQAAGRAEVTAGDDAASLRAAGIRSLALISADSQTLVSFRGHLLEALRADGVAVDYIGPAVDAPTRAWLDERRIGIHEIPISRNTLAPAGDLRTLLALYSTLRGRRPDAVLTTRVKSSVYGLLAAAAAGIRYRFAFITGLGYAFVERPGDRRWQWINRIARTLYGFGLRRATAVAFQNADDERDFRAWGLVPAPVPSTVVSGSGVDTDHYSPAPLPEGVRCLFVGRLLSDKGLGEYIEAARIVRHARSEAVFTILGPTETNPAAFPAAALDAAVRDGTVGYAGSADDVRPAIADCRIFVLPSYREGTPRSVLEAMAMGRPIVTTDVPGCRDTVEHGRNGLLVPARDAQALAAAILELADDPVRAAAMGGESRRIAEEKYDVRKVTSDLLGFYARAARSSGR